MHQPTDCAVVNAEKHSEAALTYRPDGLKSVRRAKVQYNISNWLMKAFLYHNFMNHVGHRWELT